MTKLRVAPDLALPQEAVTQTFGVLGKRGTGKTYTVGVLVEEMIKAGFHVVIVDPTDVWWGLRSAKDGKGPGLPVVIFGGSHGDLPLVEQDGEILARAIIEQSITCVLSLRHLKKKARNRFLASFLEELYHLKADRREPLHLVVDEADRAAPQKLMKGEEQERVLGALDEIVRMGRSSGFGVTLLTQRSAVISKDVLSQTEVLITTRTISPQDLAAVDAWIEHHDVEEKRDEFIASLPSLPAGDSWWWSPGWLDVFKHTRVREKETFDSSYTPKPGEKARAPRKMADVDLETLRGQLAKTIEREQARDPAHLQKRIRELEAEAKTRQATVGAEDRKALTEKLRAGEGRVRQLEKELLAAAKRAAADQANVEALVKRHLATTVKDIRRQNGELKRTLESGIAKLSRALQSVQREIGAADQALKAIAEIKVDDAVELAPLALGAPPAAPDPAEQARDVVAGWRAERPRPVPVQREPRPPAPRSSEGNGAISGVQQRILDTIRAFELLGIDQPDRVNVAAWCGYHQNAKSFSNALGSSRTAGLVWYPDGGKLALTDEGRALASDDAPITSLEELHAKWFERLSGVERKILEAVMAHRDGVDRDELAAEVEYHPNAKSFSNSLGRLRSLGLITKSGPVKPTTTLYPEELV